MAPITALHLHHGQGQGIVSAQHCKIGYGQEVTPVTALHLHPATVRGRAVAQVSIARLVTGKVVSAKRWRRSRHFTCNHNHSQGQGSGSGQRIQADQEVS